MKQFHYRALDRHGDATDGSIQADSLHAAMEQLRTLEVNVLSIEEGARRYEPDGQRPGPTPRDVEVRIKDVPGGWFLTIFGAMFGGIALIIILTGIGVLIAGQRVGLFLTLFPLLHLAVGIGALRYVFKRRTKRANIYRFGEVAMATIDGVGYNRSIKVNGRSPHEMTWSFELNGHRFSDKHSSFDDRVLTFSPGDRLWVLYDPADPEESVEWPPLTD